MHQPTPPSFESWLGAILGQDQHQVRRLIKDATGLHFLIAWSLFESKCCGGDFKAARHCSAAALPDMSAEEKSVLRASAGVLHTRYQSKSNLNRLAPPDVTPYKALEAFTLNLQKPFNELTAADITSLCVFVASRVRNNMFHGQKGIDDWLHDKALISTCTTILQMLVSASERAAPTLSVDVKSAA